VPGAKPPFSNKLLEKVDIMPQPNDFVFRPATIEDLLAVVDLVNACSVAEGGRPDETPEVLRSDWETTGFNLATDSWAAVTPDGRIVGYEQIELTDDGSPLELDGYVHPEFAGCGIGSRLLEWAEQRTRKVLALQGIEQPVAVRGTIAAVNAAACQLFTGAGFQPIRHFWRMDIEFDRPPAAPAWPEGVAVRVFTPEQDERVTYEVIEDAFEDHWEHTRLPFDEWVRARTRRDDFDPLIWFLASHGSDVVGAALAYPRGERYGWVRGLGVRRDWRGRGLGMALLLQCFGAFYARGWSGAGLGVDAESLTGATRLYERAGMRVSERYQTFEKLLHH
jgi:mycothiol synthase